MSTSHDFPPSRRKLHNSAFTLIELLVVVSIIALLISLLLPALGAARDSARGVKCLSNEKQIGISLNVYLTDYKNIMPIPPLKAAPATAALVHAVYFKEIYETPSSDYVEGTVLDCPSRGDEELTNFGIRITETLDGQPYNHVTGYSFDEATYRYNAGVPTVTRIEDIVATAETIYVFGGRGTYRWKPGVANLAFNTDEIDSHIRYRHSEATNALYFDGHAAGGVTQVDPEDVQW